MACIYHQAASHGLYSRSQKTCGRSQGRKNTDVPAKQHKGRKYIWLGVSCQIYHPAFGRWTATWCQEGWWVREREKYIPVIFSPLVRLQLLHKHIRDMMNRFFLGRWSLLTVLDSISWVTEIWEVRKQQAVSFRETTNKLLFQMSV